MNVEKTIEFLLDQTAKHDAQIGQITVQLAEVVEITKRQVERLDTVIELMVDLGKIVKRHEDRLDKIDGGEK